MQLQKSSLKPSELNMTPMIDIVFLLISFFTLVINFSQSEQHERVQLPKSELAQPPDTMPSEPLTLQVSDTDEIFLGSTVCFLDDLSRTGMGEPFSKALRDELRVLAAISRVDPNAVSVIIRADENVRAGFIQKLIISCQKQGLENFILRAKQARYED
ncbi:MAG: biopolymer transporter ExbD [Planctomycetia bacterium]|nr:biopolymer transporter ExbD [Planctomycetia bacterium]